MIYGNAAWGFRETPIEQQLEITENMGLSVLELGIANAPNDLPLDLTDGEINKVISLYKKHNVKLLCAATGDDFSNNNTDDVPKIKRVIDICSKLKVKYLRIFAGFTPLCDMSAEAFDTMISALTEVCEYAKAKDVVPVIETHGGVNAFDDGVEHIMSTTTELETLKKIIALIPDDAKICYDPANLYAVGVKRPEIFYNEIKDKVAYAHFKDFKILPSGHLKPSFCGDSDMDWDAVLYAMKDFDGPALFEYENTEDVSQGLEKSYKFISERN